MTILLLPITVPRPADLPALPAPAHLPQPASCFFLLGPLATVLFSIVPSLSSTKFYKRTVTNEFCQEMYLITWFNLTPFSKAYIPQAYKYYNYTIMRPNEISKGHVYSLKTFLHFLKPLLQMKKYIYKSQNTF